MYKRKLTLSPVCTCFAINSFVLAPAVRRTILRPPNIVGKRFCSQSFCYFNITKLLILERTFNLRVQLAKILGCSSKFWCKDVTFYLMVVSFSLPWKRLKTWKLLKQYTLFQNGRHFSILLFTCKLTPVASFMRKYSFEFRV